MGGRGAISARRATCARAHPPPTHPQIAEIESAIGSGQVEQLIEQAKGELILIPEYASWKAWEVPPLTPEDDLYSELYEDLDAVDPDSVDYRGLGGVAAGKRAAAAAGRSGAPPSSLADMYEARAAQNREAEAKKVAAAAAAAARAAAAAAAPKA